MIKAIIFDCFGVLSNVNLWHEFLSGLEESKVEEAKELNRQCDAGIITREEFLAQIKEVTGEVLHDVESLKSTESLKNKPLMELIEHLHEQGYKIGILSNIGSNWITDEFLTEQEQKLFDAMVFSFAVGTTKPSPEIYKIACERLNVDPSAAVFIDDIKDYCTAAEAVGLKGIHYQNFKQLKNDLELILNQS